ncbi:MAG: hypothetical protein JRE64_23715 [Deltaproteobacteria bacterium]|nr:hypothetical protein [Deltaproteobacteria bacterium]
MAKLKLALSAFIGGFFCLLADLAQKSEASSIRKIGLGIGDIVGASYANGRIIAVVLVLICALVLYFIFDPDTKPKAFYLGASVLALMMTFTPYEPSKGFDTQPNSVKIVLNLETEDNTKIDQATLTLWNSQQNKIMARTQISAQQFTFYRNEGSYILTIEMSGHETEMRNIELKEGVPFPDIDIILHRSVMPGFIQKMLK